ncbi:DUF3306 domain-containing protein [Stappia indica]|uniref:DUF3306 domain-containing protein n=1 Tax=Stappia indica TaxID=538381 RepID=UPI001CD1F091|nr:DUF3306 domain-containing protein [Stappia indica]MCA1297267.1 DUF3306 domain-containing protein [Stappia indica]
MSGEDTSGFLTRWSRRKQAARAEDAERPEEAAALEPDDADETVPADAEEARLEAENRAAAEAVDLETLTFDSDYSVFLKKGVPASLKNAALRRLWRSNPVLACVDGLNDYDGDFRDVKSLGEGLKTAWEVGKGYRRKGEELDAARKAAASDAPDAAPQPAEAVAAQEGAPADEPDEKLAQAVAEPEAPIPAAEAPRAQPVERPAKRPRRRMTFT